VFNKYSDNMKISLKDEGWTFLPQGKSVQNDVAKRQCTFGSTEGGEILDQLGD
jgi:hypothetical protein